MKSYISVALHSVPGRRTLHPLHRIVLFGRARGLEHFLRYFPFRFFPLGSFYLGFFWLGSFYEYFPFRLSTFPFYSLKGGKSRILTVGRFFQHLRFLRSFYFPFR